MSKTRVPRLPVGSSRSAIQAYVKEVRVYAQKEFQRGATEQEVYNAVNEAGVTLPALRSVISREYLTFLGVGDSKIKGIKFLGMLCACVFYGFTSAHVITDSPIYRYALPALLAVLVFLGIENLGTKFWKMRLKPKAQ